MNLIKRNKNDFYAFKINHRVEHVNDQIIEFYYITNKVTVKWLHISIHVFLFDLIYIINQQNEYIRKYLRIRL